MGRRLAAGVGLALTAVSTAAGQPAAGPRLWVAYAEKTAPAEAKWRRLESAAWAAPAPIGTVTNPVAWQELRLGSDWTRMALVSVDWARVARLRVWDGSAWGAAATLTTDTGVRGTKMVAAAFEHRSGEVLAVYRVQNATQLRYRTHAGALSAEGTVAPLTLDAAPRWITLASKPGSDEIIMVVATAARLYSAVWDGAAWGSAATLETQLPGQGRAFDVVYTSQSGQALVVWGRASGAPRARVWTGLTWGAAVTLPSAGADVRWVTLAANPQGSSDEVLLATLDAAGDVNLNQWDGLAWGSFTEVATTAAATDQPRVDVAYRPDGEGALAVWHIAGQDAVRFRTWNGVSWSSTQTGPDIGMPTYQVVLTPGQQGDEVVMVARGYVSPGGIQDYLLYTAEGNIVVGDAVISGPVGDAVPGVALPTPPAGGSGGANLNYGHNQSVTLTPGTHGQLRFGNGCTASIGAGTYRYESVQSGNNLTLNFDTSAGNVVFILTNGDWQSMNTSINANNGPGRVFIHVLNGNFELGNNASIQNCDVTVYNGNIDIGQNAEIAGMLHAKSNVEIGSGVVEEPWYFWSGPGCLAAAVWEGDVPGARADLSGNPSGSPIGGVVAVSDRPPPARRRVTGWTEIDPTR